MPRFRDRVDNYLKNSSSEAENIILQYIQQDRVPQEDEQWVYTLLEKAKNPNMKLNSLMWLSAKGKYLEQVSKLLETSETEINFP